MGGFWIEEDLAKGGSAINGATLLSINISIFQTTHGKFAWGLIVLSCSIGAGLLINNSYSDLLKSPVATTITQGVIILLCRRESWEVGRGFHG